MSGAPSPDIVEIWGAPAGRSAALDELIERRTIDIPVGDIYPNPHQPRASIDPDGQEFRELVDSIRSQGLLQPILVTPSGDEAGAAKYQLIAGERRWRAMRVLAGEHNRYSRISATVIRLGEDESGAQSLTRALAENVIRAGLTTAETAAAIAQLRGRAGWSFEEIAARMGLSISRVQALAAVARHDVVLAAVDSGEINQAQAIAIARGAQSPEDAAELVAQSRGRDARATKRAVKARRETRDLRVPAPESLVRTPPPLVDVDALPIMRLAGRGSVPRGEIETAIASTCAVLGWWPDRPSKRSER
jgi:ParB family transcriptional regulator, chromosome partitioning protein